MPDLTDPARFPVFTTLPPATAEAPTGQDDTSPPSYLLAQVKENMTITQPTLIVTDRAGVDFALIFEDRAADLKPLRKGRTAVVPRPARTEREGEGKKAIVRVPRGVEVGSIPAGIEQIFELALVMNTREAEDAEDGEGAKKTRSCAACGEPGAELMKCTGCHLSEYCSKACQVKAWSELGHKSNCKTIKAIRELWP